MLNARSFITAVEAWRLTPSAAMAAFLAIVAIRYGLEALLEGHQVLALHLPLRLGLSDFLHTLLSWAVLFWLLALGLAVGSGRGLPRANRMALACFPLIWLPPLWDGLFGSGGAIAYQHDFAEFTASFLGLFNPAVHVSYVTPGVRVEVAFAVALAVLYAGVMNRGAAGWLRALLTGCWVYGVVFLLGYLPALWFALLGEGQVALLNRSVLGGSSTASALYWYLPLLALVGPLWLRYSSPAIGAAMWASLRPSRLLIYLAIANLALLSAADIGLVGWDWLNPYDIAEVVVMNLALTLAFIAMTILNDLQDIAIDRVSNPQRPLVTGIISSSDFAMLAWACGGLALALAVVIDEVAVYPLALTMALGYLYSAPPFRLRRFVGIAHLVLAAIAAAVYLYGASLALGNLTFQQIDRGQMLALMLLFFIGAHFKDLKDMEGDRQAGVTTLATLFGPQRAYWMIGAVVIAGVLVLLTGGLVANSLSTWLALALFTGGWLLVRNGERVFWVMLLSLGVIFL